MWCTTPRFPPFRASTQARSRSRRIRIVVQRERASTLNFSAVHTTPRDSADSDSPINAQLEIGRLQTMNVCVCKLCRCVNIVRWLSGGCTCTVQPGRDDTRVFPIWVMMNSKFVTLIWVVATNRATKLRFHHDPNRENSCVVASRLDGGGTTT